MFILNKIINLIFYKSFFRDKYLLYMRTLINKLYIKVFKLDNKSYFSLSNKTINCLINKGSHNSNEGIELIRRYQKITNDKVKLENIILDKIL